MGFDLENYETVKERKKRFYDDHPSGSLVSDIYFFEKKHIVIRGLVFKTKEDQEKNLPTGVGIAEEFQGVGGFANTSSWTENCCESAIGRGLDNAGYSGNNKCSREEMEKVKNHESDKEPKPNEKTPGDIEYAEKMLTKSTLNTYHVVVNELSANFSWTPEESARLKGLCQTRNEEFKIEKEVDNEKS